MNTHINQKHFGLKIHHAKSPELGEYVVSDSVVHAYGVGETVDEALEDYRMMMLDMYKNLSNNVDRLSPRLERQYKALSLQLKQEGLIEVN